MSDAKDQEGPELVIHLAVEYHPNNLSATTVVIGPQELCWKRRDLVRAALGILEEAINGMHIQALATKQMKNPRIAAPTAEESRAVLDIRKGRKG